MSTVKLVDEDTDNPRVRAAFEDVKATKKIDRLRNIRQALATHPEHREPCQTQQRGPFTATPEFGLACAPARTRGPLIRH